VGGSSRYSERTVGNWDRSLVVSGYAVHSGTAPRLQEVGILGGRLNIYTCNRNGSHEKGKGLGEKKPERLGPVTCTVTGVYRLSGLRNDESAQCKLRRKK
jgi:hypothetical protein